MWSISATVTLCVHALVWVSVCARSDQSPLTATMTDTHAGYGLNDAPGAPVSVTVDARGAATAPDVIGVCVHSTMLIF